MQMEISESDSSLLKFSPPNTKHTTMVSAGQLLGPPTQNTAISVDFIIPQTKKETDNLLMMGLTENCSPTFLSTGNPCLDFFYHVVPGTSSDDLIQRLELAWAHDPLTTLKLICNLRGVRGTGKSDKQGFYTSSLWLHKSHPKTLALNLKALVHFGYFKDLPEILYRLLHGSEVRKLAKQAWKENKRAKRRSPYFKRKRDEAQEEEILEGLEKIFVSEEEENLEMKTVEKISKEQARALRKEREISKAKIALDRYNNDPHYRFLFDCVCDVFAELLKSDLEFMSRGEDFKISLAAKWCPTVDSAYDKSLLICEGIARRVFPKESEKEYEGIEEAHYAYRVRDRLRKQVLVPLHKILELPEVFMSAKQWDSLPYNRVASVAMKTYKGLFEKHDKERFEEYLEKVKSGKATIAAGALLPHEIIKSLDEDGGQVAELQWERMVSDVAKKGKLTNCIAVCDVSGSMNGTPMEVCVALGLLVSELSEEPWKGKLFTFSQDPQLHLIKGDTLLAKTEFIRKMDWGMNTDLQKVFDQILEVAVEAKLTEEQLIKRVFVFSDMEFDSARLNTECIDLEPEEEMKRGWETEEETKRGWETDYEVIQRKFREKGYNKAPEVVFWNLRDSRSTPVVANQTGVALVSGFAKNLLTLFLEEGGIVNPEDVMRLAIAGEEYKKLVVYD
ncbi:hypothetical protein RGQ29_023338 [Quercus rubra]|uniref:Uncharacterized protein n=1 Tax=Quercus rubra TaxID=3512 RepID=A0AAN7F5C5_QUERU|nr:hypothetical protein RGQ29_023338 [Quercus rubra]